MNFLSRYFKNQYGRSKGYGGCSHCKDTWDWKESFSIPFTETSSMFPLCKECFEKLSINEINYYIKQLVNVWKSYGSNTISGLSCNQIEQNAINNVKKLKEKMK